MIPESFLAEINASLAAHAEDVCRLLLPGGQRKGHAWRCGGVDGGPGKSLEVELEGEKAGVWHDRATGEKGRLLKLWQLNRSLPFSEAVAQAADFSRMAPPFVDETRIDPRAYQFESPSPLAAPPPPLPTVEPINWKSCVAAMDEDSITELCEWRGFSPEFVRWLVRQEAIGVFRGRFAFPVYNSAGAVVRIHYRNGSGGWLYHPQGGGESSALVIGEPSTATHTLAFESQWDAFSVLDKLEAHNPLNAATYAAFITRGANSNTDISALQTHEIIVCPQNDPPEKASKSTGRTPAEEWLHRLSQTRPKGVDFKDLRFLSP